MRPSIITTIGYEQSNSDEFIATLKTREIEVLVDIRERAQSRKPGFSKSALSSAVKEAGMEYIHLRALGDPKEGRDAARSGEFDKFRRIFSEVLLGEEAKAALEQVGNLAISKRICLMCYERDHQYCHRKMVSDELEKSWGLKTIHLGVPLNDSNQKKKRRMLHTCESPAA